MCKTLYSKMLRIPIKKGTNEHTDFHFSHFKTNYILRSVTFEHSFSQWRQELMHKILSLAHFILFYSLIYF